MQMSESVSISPLTGNSYIIPKNKRDDNLKTFLKKNKSKKIIVVMGLGFVGSVMSIVCANSEYEDYAVIGLDLKNKNSYWKIASINENKFPVVSSDPKIKKYFDKTRKKNNFYATYDVGSLKYANIIIIDINLDVSKIKNDKKDLVDFDVPMKNFKSAVNDIANNCKENALILTETTIPPGTSKKIILPIIKEVFKKRNLDFNKLSIGHSYERVMPGPHYIDSIKNFYRVYSGINKKSADKVEKFLRTIINTRNFPLTRLKNTESSEMAKVLENSFRAMNISFIVEWSRFAEKASVNIYEVVDAIRQRPTHANLMYPGIGVGGYCLTKDPLIASWASKKIYKSNEGLYFSEKAVENNDKMPIYCYKFIKKIIKEKEKKINNIALLGVAYAPGIGDTRFSPVDGLYELLKKDKYKISCHDPYLDFWDEKSILIENNIIAFLRKKFDMIILSTGHEIYKRFKFEKYIKNDPIIIDTIGIINTNKYINRKNVYTLGVGNQ